VLTRTATCATNTCPDNHWSPPATANTAFAAARAPGERGFATLKTWRILTRIRCCPHRITNLAKAVLTLEHGHH
jgi:hypothetical protein